MLQTFMGGFGTRPAAQESTKFRRTPEMVGRSHADPIGDAFRSFVGFLTTPLRQQFPQGSPRDINIQNPNDPRNAQIIDQLGPQEQDLIGQAFEADTRSPARRWWESTEFPPVAIARGAWDTFVGQASPLDVALEAAGAGIAARGRRAPLAIGGARATPAPTTRGSESALMKAFDESGDMPWEEYGTYGQDIVDNLLRDATITEAVEGTAGFSLADEAFRLADEALRDPDITNINTRRGNLNLPEGGSLMGRGTPETGPTGYTPHGGSLLDNALSGRGDNVDFIRTGATQRPDETIFPELDFSRQDEPFHGDDLLDELARFVGDETNPPSPVIEPSDVQRLIDEGKVRIRSDGSLEVLDESITGGSAIDDAYLDAPEYLDDPGSPDAIEAAQEKKINDQIEAWHNKNRDIIDDAFNGLTKDELRAKYPDADDLTLDMVLDYKAEEDAFEALFSDDALEGADEMLDLDAALESSETPEEFLDELGLTPDDIDATLEEESIDNAIENIIEASAGDTEAAQRALRKYPPRGGSFTEGEREFFEETLEQFGLGDLREGEFMRRMDEFGVRPEARRRAANAFQRAVHRFNSRFGQLNDKLSVTDQHKRILRDYLKEELERL